MSLADEYTRQTRWRPWAALLDVVPKLVDQTVLDLGCAVGEQAAAMARKGARVIGVDHDDELLAAARAKGLTNVEFLGADLRSRLEIGHVDGIWCSFAAAYFPDLSSVLSQWKEYLRPAGWIVLTEVDDLFGHEPLGAEPNALLAAYADEALAKGRYDFRMGRKLESHLRASGFVVEKVITVPDPELSFAGPAPTEIVEAWSARFERMTTLRDFCGVRFAQVRHDFLHCLESAKHRSSARVFCCVAHQGEPANQISA